MSFTVKLADKIIRIENIHPELESLCKDYLAKDSLPDFTVSLTQNDINYEQEHAIDPGFSSSYFESLALLRKISNIFPNYQRFLIHGASISYEGNAFLFTAPSGTGKSTHIRLWRKYLGDKVKIVNGDKPFISINYKRETNHTLPTIYGTPWSGKEGWHRNCSEPLAGICFVERGTTNSIQRLNPEDCIHRLFCQIYIPEDEIAVSRTLELADSLLKHVPVYLLTCDMSEDAVRCSFEALTGLSYPN